MPKQVNTFTQFAPLRKGEKPNVLTKNDCYLSVVFLGGNYLSSGSLLQRVFGGSDEVALIAGLRLPPDGLVITGAEEPNIILDKRSIKPGKNTNIPSTQNLLVNVPVYMASIGFSFKVATIKRNDNFSIAFDVLNDNKGILDGLSSGVVGKVLGVGKVVKDMFDKIDAANDRSLIQLVISDFIVPTTNDATGSNMLQEGYLFIFVKDEEPEDNESTRGLESFSFESKSGEENVVSDQQTVFLDIKAMESTERGLEAAVEPQDLDYDEATKTLKLNGKIVANTYLVFKFQKALRQGENLSTPWSRKLASSVALLENEFDKSKEKLKELQPKAIQLFNEGTALLSEEAGYTPVEKTEFIKKYRELISAEIAKFV